MAPIIQAKRLAKTADDKTILRMVTFDVEAGETMAILGPNGAGKSTLLKIFSTLVKPSSGELWIGGHPVSLNREACKRQIGYLLHNSLLYDHLTAWQNLSFYGNMYRVPQLRKRIEELLKQVGLYHFRDEPVRLFSRGMVQRLSIARAILHRPSVLLLDEPHTGLDVEAVQLFNRMLVDLREQGSSIVMVTHDFEQALAICDRICILRRGQIAGPFPVTDMQLSVLRREYEQQVVGE